MALKPGSPARDAATGSTILADQRRFPLVGPRDLGAYEAGTLDDNFNAFIWETLPASATDEQHDFDFDYDGDGSVNFDEWLAGTVVTDLASVFRVTNLTRSGSIFSITFPSVLGRNYTLESSTDLVMWAPADQGRAGTGNPITLEVLISGFDRVFLRVRVGP